MMDQEVAIKVEEAVIIADCAETKDSSSKEDWDDSRVATPLNGAADENAGAVDEIERASFATAVVDQDEKSRAAVVWYQDASNRRVLVCWALMLVGLLLWVIPLYGDMAVPIVTLQLRPISASALPLNQSSQALLTAGPYKTCWYNRAPAVSGAQSLKNPPAAAFNANNQSAIAQWLNNLVRGVAQNLAPGANAPADGCASIANALPWTNQTTAAQLAAVPGWYVSTAQFFGVIALLLFLLIAIYLPYLIFRRHRRSRESAITEGSPLGAMFVFLCMCLLFCQVFALSTVSLVGAGLLQNTAFIATGPSSVWQKIPDGGAATSGFGAGFALWLVAAILTYTMAMCVLARRDGDCLLVCLLAKLSRKSAGETAADDKKASV